MFFYIFHHINHYLFKPTDKPHSNEQPLAADQAAGKSDAAVNVRTLIMGGIAYILFHGYLYSKRMSEYFLKTIFGGL